MVYTFNKRCLRVKDERETTQSTSNEDRQAEERLTELLCIKVVTIQKYVRQIEQKLEKVAG